MFRGDSEERERPFYDPSALPPEPEEDESDDEQLAEEPNEVFVEQEEENQLSYFYAAMFATVIEDTLLELRILGECNNELRISKTRADIKYWKAVKYGVEQADKKDELDSIDPMKLGCNEYKLDKLEADRKYIESVFLAGYKDMALKNNSQAFVNHINKKINQEEYAATIQEEEAKNRQLKKDLTKQLRQQRNHIKSVIYDTEAHITDLRTQVEDASLMAEIRSRYVDNWQRARTEQHIQTIQDTERVPTDIIEYHKLRSEHEQRVHSEVELMMNIKISETLEKVEEWMERYDKDMEKVDLKIQIKKNDYQNIVDRRKQLEKTIEDHEELMKKWIEFKDERERLRLYRLKMTNAALTVQAWWRGLLVRRQLGPYKPKKKVAAAAAAQTKKKK